MVVNSKQGADATHVHLSAAHIIIILYHTRTKAKAQHIRLSAHRNCFQQKQGQNNIENFSHFRVYCDGIFFLCLELIFSF